MIRYQCLNDGCEAVFLIDKPVMRNAVDVILPDCPWCLSRAKLVEQDDSILSAEPDAWDNFIR